MVRSVDHYCSVSGRYICTVGCLTVILQGELREIIKWHQLPSVLPVQHDSVILEVTGVSRVIFNKWNISDLSDLHYEG